MRRVKFVTRQTFASLGLATYSVRFFFGLVLFVSFLSYAVFLFIQAVCRCESILTNNIFVSGESASQAAATHQQTTFARPARPGRGPARI